MRLVTFTVGNGPPRAGALVEGDRKVVDLGGKSVLDIVAGGESALEDTRKRPAGSPGRNPYDTGSFPLRKPGRR